MKKLILFALLISVITSVGFWGGKKMGLLMHSADVATGQSWYLSLGLNTQQAELLRKRDAAFRKETDEVCMRICKGRLELLNAMRDPRVELEVIYKKIEEVGALQILIEKEVAAHILKVKKDLSPEQSEAYLNQIRKGLEDSMHQSGYSEAVSKLM